MGKRLYPSSPSIKSARPPSSLVSHSDSTHVHSPPLRPKTNERVGWSCSPPNTTAATPSNSVSCNTSACSAANQGVCSAAAALGWRCACHWLSATWRQFSCCGGVLDWSMPPRVVPASTHLYNQLPGCSHIGRRQHPVQIKGIRRHIKLIEGWWVVDSCGGCHCDQGQQVGVTEIRNSVHHPVVQSIPAGASKQGFVGQQGRLGRECLEEVRQETVPNKSTSNTEALQCFVIRQHGVLESVPCCAVLRPAALCHAVCK